MIIISLSLLCYVISGILDAVMDITTQKYNASIFSHWNPKYWNPAISWENKYIDGDVNKGRRQINLGLFKINVPVQLTDGWHLLKMLREILNVTAIIMAINVSMPFSLMHTIYLFILFGVTRNLMFSLFYNKILKL